MRRGCSATRAASVGGPLLARRAHGTPSIEHVKFVCTVSRAYPSPTSSRRTRRCAEAWVRKRASAYPSTCWRSSIRVKAVQSTHGGRGENSAREAGYGSKLKPYPAGWWLKCGSWVYAAGGSKWPSVSSADEAGSIGKVASPGSRDAGSTMGCFRWRRGTRGLWASMTSAYTGLRSRPMTV
jgi:hypothetical protein